MLLSEYIKRLQEFAAKNPDLEVAITQEGYYASGKFADLYETPEIETIHGQKYFCLGNSSQNY